MGGPKTPEQIAAMRERTGAGVRNLCEEVMPWATPDAGAFNDSESPESWKARQEAMADKFGRVFQHQPLGLQVRSPWATPTNEDGESSGWRPNKPMEAQSLNAQITKAEPWPTPTVQDGENDAGPSQFARNTLPLNAEVVRQEAGPWSTPQTSDRKKGLSLRESRRSDDLPDEVLRAGAPGLLNPDWVETLVGLPVGWTKSNGPSLLNAGPPHADSSSSSGNRRE
jgi:hypothetical protein